VSKVIPISNTEDSINC